MHVKLILIVGTALLAAGCAKPAPPVVTAPEKAALISGIDLSAMDKAARPQDDLYRHINGTWLDTFEIPADKGGYYSFSQVFDATQTQLRELVDALSRQTDPADPAQQKIADLYASYMDEAPLEALALKPLQSEFARVDALKDKKELAALLAHLQQIGVDTPFTPIVHLDAKDPTRYVVQFEQSGLGMPDRDYYLLDDTKLKDARTHYLAHIQKMLELAGDPAAARNAGDILALETQLAKVQWTKVEQRDPVKAYNKVALGGLAALTPTFEWKSYLSGALISGKVEYVIVGQPSYLRQWDPLLRKTPLPVWKAYLRWHILTAFAPYLSKVFVDENFAFVGTAMRGIPEIQPRWKRGLNLLETSIGDGLGKLYVAKYFPPEYKARIDQLVRNLLTIYDADIDTLDWMSPETKHKAKDKLAKFTQKIGYPDKWRDYGELAVRKDDLMGNVIRAQVFEYNRNIRKLGTPVDRAEWDMTPQTINAYYNPEMNEIVFPAAILQPPFFNPRADDAVNYGGIGGVIGHEISHGFDDQGSQYDGNGVLLAAPGWFTVDDLKKFKDKNAALVAQYAAFEPVPGYHVNGELTLGENIADNAGIAVAYKAYKLSLRGGSAAAIDGFSGEQRFFAGWAQVWRGKARVDEQIMEIKIDPHSPGAVRGTVPVRTLDAFYEAFAVKEGDHMYLPPAQRVSLW